MPEVTSAHISFFYLRKIERVSCFIHRKMSATSKGRMCFVAGCSKRRSDSISVHMFQKDDRQRSAWIRFVKLTRADWTGPSQYTVICSNHFNPECYEKQCTLMVEFGFPTKKYLVPWSIPYIYPKRKREDLNEAFLESPSRLCASSNFLRWSVCKHTNYLLTRNQASSEVSTVMF